LTKTRCLSPAYSTFANMYPELFRIGNFTVQSYGFMILTGVMLAWWYMYRHTRMYKLGSEDISEFFLYGFLAVFVGGKLFFYLEDPMRYIEDPARMLESPGSGFVFYGSFLVAVPVFIWWFRKRKLPVLAMFDIVGASGTLVHGFGKIGCLLAGCCHGKICDPKWGIVYNHPKTHADPAGVPLYPTQVLDAALILGLFLVIARLHNNKRFDGQLFLLYAIVYAIGRFITEFLRGDEERGFLFGGLLSYSQLIAILVLGVSLFFYFRLRRNPIVR